MREVFSHYGKVNKIDVKTPQKPPYFAFLEFDEPEAAAEAIEKQNKRTFADQTLRVEYSRGGVRDSKAVHFDDDRAEGKRYSRGGTDDNGTELGAGRRGPPHGAKRRPPVRTGGGGSAPRTNYRVKVRNLPSSTSWQDLKDHFKKLTENVIYSELEKSGTEFVGTVDLDSYEDMRRAVDRVHGSYFSGGADRQDTTRLDVRPEREDERPRPSSDRDRKPPRQGSRSRSRSRSRDRSYSYDDAPSERERSRGTSGGRRDRSRRPPPPDYERDKSDYEYDYGRSRARDYDYGDYDYSHRSGGPRRDYRREGSKDRTAPSERDREAERGRSRPREERGPSRERSRRREVERDAPQRGRPHVGPKRRSASRSQQHGDERGRSPPPYDDRSYDYKREREPYDDRSDRGPPRRGKSRG